MNRDACVVALGGGWWATWLGLRPLLPACVDYVQVPTTLLAQVDSSVAARPA